MWQRGQRAIYGVPVAVHPGKREAKLQNSSRGVSFGKANVVSLRADPSPVSGPEGRAVSESRRLGSGELWIFLATDGQPGHGEGGPCVQLGRGSSGAGAALVAQ